MGYQQGLSGLAGASNALDVIGNNIANANTVGFKSSTAQFSDMYANSIATSVNTQIGIGTALASVQQQFGQGTINTTNSSLDVAINGNGFFQMSNNGTITYTRDGTFQRDKNGYIVNSQGLNLMGYAADKNGVINTAQTVPLQAPTTNIAPTATTKITGQFNLNSQDTVPTKTPFDATDTTTYNYSTSIQVYDSLGGSQAVNMYFVKTAAGTWEAYAGVQGGTTNDLGTIQFDSSGAISGTTTGSPATPTAALGQFQFTVPNTDGSATPQTLTLDLTGTTQYGGKDGVNNLAQDGYASGTLTTFYDRHRRQAHRQLLERADRRARPDRARELQQSERARQHRRQPVCRDGRIGRPADLGAGQHEPRHAAGQRARELERRPHVAAREPDHRAAQLPGERADDQDAADRRPDADQSVTRG